MARKFRTIRIARRGFTLVEALVAIAVTLIMMLALSQGFVMMSQSISEGRAKLTLSDQLRGISSVLREDLEGMTAGGDPNSEACRLGYLEYYEGPISDYLPALVNFDSTQANLEEKNRAGRYGDFDDILAFTAKAKKGRWFYGEVPYPMVMGPAQMAAGVTVQAFTAEDWARTVTVASDTAEIVYFMLPYPADPTQFPVVTTGIPYVNFVEDPSLPQEIRDKYVLSANLAPNIGDVDAVPGVPDRMVLCRRVLIVKPELNLPTGTMMPGTSVGTLEPTLFHDPRNTVTPASQLKALTLGAPGSANVGAYRVGMQFANQRCDLSVRRASDGVLTDFDPISANTLSDLQDPKNRFAHTVLPVDGTSNTTMPVWSLSGPIPLQNQALTALTTTWFGASIAATGQLPEVGFILPQFMRQRRTDPATGTNAAETEVRFEMAFSEVVATNVIGFDVRGFDSNLTQWYHPGADAPTTPTTPSQGAGVFGVDDDGANGVDDIGELGWFGSDDLIVSPADPGFGNVIQRLYAAGYWDNSLRSGVGDWNLAAYPTVNRFTARKGGFVDLGYPLRLRASALIENSKIPGTYVGMINTWATGTTTGMPQLSSDMSLTVPGGAIGAGLPNFSVNAGKSGKVVYDASNQLRVYQPTFDTFTSRYETDGYQQSGATGTIWINGQYQYMFAYGQVPNVPSSDPMDPILPAKTADRGANGVDDDGFNGIDDLGEKDAAPPIASPLKAIQVIIRVEDKGANAIQQVAVDHELRLEN